MLNIKFLIITFLVCKSATYDCCARKHLLTYKCSDTISFYHYDNIVGTLASEMYPFN